MKSLSGATVSTGSVQQRLQAPWAALGPMVCRGSQGHTPLSSLAPSTSRPFSRHCVRQVIRPLAPSSSPFPGVRPRGVGTSAVAWDIQVSLYADYTDEPLGIPNLELNFVAGEPADAPRASMNTAVPQGRFASEWFPLPAVGYEPTRKGVTLSGQVNFPDDFGDPGACLITYTQKAKSKIDRVYIRELKATPHGAPDDSSQTISFLTNSWVVSAGQSGQHGKRIFFTGRPCLPGEKLTPAGLISLREEELSNLRGDGQPPSMRKDGDRIYQYDVYNDLGGAKQWTDNVDKRPILGEHRGGKLPYPRRLRTGRPVQKMSQNPYRNQEFEENPPPKAIPWLPYDEMFFAAKQDEFSDGKTYALGTALSSVIEQLFKFNPDVDNFAGFFAVDNLYNLARQHDQPLPEKKKAVMDKVHEAASPFATGRCKLAAAYLSNQFPEEVRELIEERLGSPATLPIRRLFRKLFPVVDEAIVSFLEGLVAKWPLPLVRDLRKVSWQTDEEVGRQAVAGCNPFTIQIADDKLWEGEEPEVTVTDENVAGLLDGLTLQQAIGNGKLFYQDYHTVLADDIVPQVEGLRREEGSDRVGYQYAGRGFFYKSDETKALSVVAIELQDPATRAVRVFSPTKDKPEVWELAKAVYSTLDAAVHQVVSHFGETHATMEPFAIATRRQLSALHPVFQLMQPHFRYTLAINANARSSLINAGGIVETVFTPGPFSMAFSAGVYEATWKFKEQGLPYDLEARGLASLQHGIPKPVLKDFPYAEDGLLVWNAIEEYFGKYLRLYYCDKGSNGKLKVTDDEELVNWYKEIQEEGHPDVAKDGWFELKDIESLKNILATMAWIGSAHHAAVNFGQYGYTGYMPNKASYIAHAIPKPDTDEEKALLDDYEFKFLETLSDPVRAVKTMLIVKLLSSHARDEVYLVSENDWILDPQAKRLQGEFIQALKDAEATMHQRNQTLGRASRARHSPAGVPYELLYPSGSEVNTSNQGVTGRGIPYSVSI